MGIIKLVGEILIGLDGYLPARLREVKLRVMDVL